MNQYGGQGIYNFAFCQMIERNAYILSNRFTKCIMKGFLIRWFWMRESKRNPVALEQPILNHNFLYSLALNIACRIFQIEEGRE